jgi:hypothetical protein
MTAFRYVVAPAMALLALPAPAGAHGVACGATITRSTTLRADLADCPGDGLVVGADNLTLDLGRHTVDGVGAGAGVRLAGHRGVRISGGTIREFASGIVLDGADGNRVSGVTVSASAGRGIDVLGGSDGNAFERVSSSGNRTGIAVTGSSANAIRFSDFSGNAATGVLLFGASRSQVDLNRVQRNVGQGIAVVEGSADNRVSANRVEGGEAGLIVDTSDRTLLAFNHVSGAGDGVTVAGNANTVTGNVVSRSVGGCENCGGWGIGVVSGDGNVVKANLVSGSAADGISVAAGWVGRNTAFGNGALGIEAAPGVTDGGGNRAWGNATAAQCAGVTCRSGGPRPAQGHPPRDRTPRRSTRRSGDGHRGHR